MKVTLREVCEFLDTTLETARYAAADRSVNGLQVESSAVEITKVCVAVDAGLSIMQEAVKRRASLLIVHHGIFWGDCLPLRGALGRKVATLIKGGCSLYASHLPLDGHMELGNAALLAKTLGLGPVEPFFPYKGVTLGVRASSPQPLLLDTLVERCKTFTPTERLTVLPFGPTNIHSVAIVTGSGAPALTECAELGLDALVSGEPKQEAYHLAKELAVSAIFAGHYETETFGVRAVGDLLSRKFGVQIEFIDEPTGI